MEQKPIDMVLHCPTCGTQHVDAPEPENEWTNPPHKSHKCHGCGNIWRPADVPTNGVADIKTRGERDTWARDLTTSWEVAVEACAVKGATTATIEGHVNFGLSAEHSERLGNLVGEAIRAVKVVPLFPSELNETEKGKVEV